MTTSARMLSALIVVAVVVSVVDGLPPSRRPEEQRDAKPDWEMVDDHLHVRRPSTDGDKVLAIGVPVAMSRYEDRAAAPSRSWWGRSNYFYRAVFKCAEGEKRDAIGICRQPWDSIEPDDYFSS